MIAIGAPPDMPVSFALSQQVTICRASIVREWEEGGAQRGRRETWEDL
jgi:hypothetical protein